MVLGFLDKNVRKINNDRNDRKASIKPHSDIASEPDVLWSESLGSNSDLQSKLIFKEALNDDTDDQADLNRRKTKGVERAALPIVGVIVLSWFVGVVGASWAWLLFGLGIVCVSVRGIVKNIVEDAIRYEKTRLHRRRVLDLDETSEWLNLILNRWWVFSSASIFTHLKKTLDPQLQESKPSFVETICLKELTLGDRTPMLRSLRSWDSQGVGGREGSAFKTNCSYHTPSGLASAPTHALSILCDLVLDSDSFSAVLAARVGHKGMGVDLDIGVEHLVLEGRILVTAYLDMEVPFPHVARLTFSFIEKPRLSFRVKILRSVQMMDMPVLKTWIYNLVTDALTTAFVDPSQLEVNIHSSDAVIPEYKRGESLARGVLTLELKLRRGVSCSGTSADDDKWVVIVVSGTTHVTSTFKSAHWHDSCSFLLPLPPAASNIVLKVKSKRLITTTLTQFEIPLQSFNLDSARVGEITLQKKGVKVMGGHVPPIHMRMEYTPLNPVNLESSIPMHPPYNTEEAGVLYIVIHGADNLLSTDASVSPYCLVFSSRKKIKTTHYERGKLSPRWESGVEILVKNISSVCLTFLVCSLPRNPKLQDGDLLGIQTLNLSSNSLPMIRKQLALNRNASSPTTEETQMTNSTLTVSLVFRSVPSILERAPKSLDSPNYRGMPLPVPAHMSPITSIASNSFPNIGSALSTSSAHSSILCSRRGSTGILPDDQNHRTKKKSNPTWLNHAKTLLSSHSDNSSPRRQDLEDILSTGLGLLELTIIRARDLVSKDLNGFSDPYCVLKVNGEVKYRTQVRKKTLHPEWNESLMTHLPKPGQNFALTLWDHDAFGMKDFLGSVSLSEEEVRNLSAAGSPDWLKLEGTKRGCLEIRIKLISEDHQFDGNSRNHFTQSRRLRRCSETLIGNQKDSSTDSDSESQTTVSQRRQMSARTFRIDKPRKSPREHFKRFNPNENILAKSSSLTSLTNGRKEDGENLNTFSASPSHIQTLYIPSNQRKSRAEILVSVLQPASKPSDTIAPTITALQREKTLVGIQVDRIEKTCSVLVENEQKCELESITLLESSIILDNTESDQLNKDLPNLPKISLNDQSEDEYGSEESCQEEQNIVIHTEKFRSKKGAERMAKTVKEKFRIFRRNPEKGKKTIVRNMV